MNLQQTREALEQNDIQIALDLGVHTQCDINSNCPLAVDLRRLITDSGVTMEQLLEGYAATQETPPDLLIDLELPEIDAKVKVRIGGKEVEVDFGKDIEDRLEIARNNKMAQLRDREQLIRNLGSRLYQTYLNQIQELKRSRTLPQLTYPATELLRHGCTLTSNGENYLFLFPRVYNPQWIHTRGTRYKMADEDIVAVKRDICIMFTISPQWKIIQSNVVTDDGNPFVHYHGRGWDCWGQVRIPSDWDRNLKTLSDLTTQLMGALATINKDSILERHPTGMPPITSLFNRSERLGEEGRTEVREEPDGAWTPDGTRPRRWGQR